MTDIKSDALKDIAETLAAADASVPPVLQAPVSKPAAKKPVSAAKARAPQPTTPAPVETTIAADRSAKDSTMTDTTIETTAQTVTDKAKTMFAEAGDRAKTTMEKGARALEDMGSFHKGNLEAIVESSKIAAKGLESMGQQQVAYLKTSYENATTAVKAMAAVKSPTELFKLQSDYARTAFDAFVAETSRSTEAALKLAGEIAQPISNRVALAAEKIKVAA